MNVEIEVLLKILSIIKLHRHVGLRSEGLWFKHIFVLIITIFAYTLPSKQLLLSSLSTSSLEDAQRSLLKLYFSTDLHEIITWTSSFFNLIRLSGVGTTCFHHAVIKIWQLIWPTACLTSTLNGNEMGATGTNGLTHSLPWSKVQVNLLNDAVCRLLKYF
jgi:hypothetical protein